MASHLDFAADVTLAHWDSRLKKAGNWGSACCGRCALVEGGLKRFRSLRLGRLMDRYTISADRGITDAGLGGWSSLWLAKDREEDARVE